MTNGGFGVQTGRMCRQHINSCHAEIHQELGRIKKRGFDSSTIRHIVFGEFIPENQATRHNELAQEINDRAERTGRGNGHNPETKHRPQEYGDIEIPTYLIAGLPVPALELSQQNVFRMKPCSCLRDELQIDRGVSNRACKSRVLKMKGGEK